VKHPGCAELLNNRIATATAFDQHFATVVRDRFHTDGWNRRGLPLARAWIAEYRRLAAAGANADRAYQSCVGEWISAHDQAQPGQPDQP
jgi:hypothetical protein